MHAICIAAVLLLSSGEVLAHVKWFAAYDLAKPPRPLFSVLTSTYFLGVFALMVPIMYFSAYADSYLARRANFLNQLLDRGNAWFEHQFFSVMQIGVLVFFGALFVYGNILLTPELSIDSADRSWVQWVQLGIAVVVLHERIAFLSAIGICVLYGDAIYRYGIFHMLDYPIFLGVAAYIFIVSLFGKRHSPLAINILRVLTGITLMWASIEKYAYPEWTFPILAKNPDLGFGINRELYMVTAGFIEFSTSFLLITGALAGRVATAILLVFFISAIPVFGVVDAIGHAVIIMVLMCMMFTPNPLSLPHKYVENSYADNAKFNVRLFYGSLLLMAGLFYGGRR